MIKLPFVDGGVMGNGEMWEKKKLSLCPFN